MRKPFSALAAATLLMFALSSVQAASISLTPANTNVSVGGLFNLDVSIDFSDDATLGGGLDVLYDGTALAFQSFTFGTTTLDLDPAFSRIPDELPNKLEGLAFGNFNGLTVGIVGTLTFQALTAGNSLLSMAVTIPSKGGDFVSANTFDVQSVTFNGANVNASAVPVPAAAWLFGSGLLGLVGIMRRKATQ